jgi:hypothetical protein
MERIIGRQVEDGERCCLLRLKPGALTIQQKQLRTPAQANIARIAVTNQIDGTSAACELSCESRRIDRGGQNIPDHDS